MSLIADALKKAQSARLGRRYLAPDPSGVLPRAEEGSPRGGQASFGSLISKIRVSPTLLVGLGSGVVLFVLLFAYFFSGRGPMMKRAVSSPAATARSPADLVLRPPPSVPAVEPLELEREPLPEAEPAEQEAVEKKIVRPREVPEEHEVAESRIPAGESKPARPVKAEGTRKKNESPKVAVKSDLSEEVRYYFNLALFYQQEKNFPLARRTYEKVIEMWPLYTEAHNNLGVVYKELGMQEQAIREFRKVLALNPAYPRAYHNLGVIYQLRRDWKRATKNYEKALSLDRNHLSSYNNLGLVYRSQKRPHDAREILQKALSINPSFPQTHYNLALVLEELGELRQARFHYQKFIDLSGNGGSRLIETVRTHLQGLR